MAGRALLFFCAALAVACVAAACASAEPIPLPRPGFDAAAPDASRSFDAS